MIETEIRRCPPPERPGANGMPEPPTRCELDDVRMALERAVSERDEANHRIANSLALASALLRRRRGAIRDAAARNALAEAETRLLAVARLHQRMGGSSDGGDVTLGGLLASLADELGVGLGLDCRSAAGDGAAELRLPAVAAGEVAMIVSELAINARKHAYGSAEEGRLEIDCRRDGTAAVVTIRDRGPGLPEGFDVRPAGGGGIGMPVIAQAVARLGGRLAAHSDGGAVFTLVVPTDQSSS